MSDNDQTSKKINNRIQQLISESEMDSEEIISYVNNYCREIYLAPKTRGMLFEIYAEVDPDDELTCFTNDITISELMENIHPEFKTKNGTDWSRRDSGYLGNKYNVINNLQGGKLFSVRLEGLNKSSVERYRSIRSDIKSNIVSQRCRILDVGAHIEVDHKNGMYDDLSNISLEDQKEDDFQPLSKSANLAKREHCKKCKESGKRYDARRLGYKEGWLVGDENTSQCPGCYWYDPLRFNKEISDNFHKTR